MEYDITITVYFQASYDKVKDPNNPQPARHASALILYLTWRVVPASPVNYVLPTPAKEHLVQAILMQSAMWISVETVLHFGIWEELL